jgi:hypothetical protein
LTLVPDLEGVLKSAAKAGANGGWKSLPEGFRDTGSPDKCTGKKAGARAAPYLTAPVPQQAATHVVLAGDRREAGTGPLAFGHAPHLLLDPSTASPLNLPPEGDILTLR